MSRTETEACNDYISQMVPDQNHRKLLLDALSRVVKSSTRRPDGLRVYVFKGTGSNGKTSFMDFIKQTVGDSGVVLTEAMLTGSLTTEIMDLIHQKQFVFVDATNLVSINSMMKILMSGSRVSCPVTSGFNSLKEYIPSCDFILCTNATFKPHPHHVITIPFELEFVDTPDPIKSKQLKKSDVTTNFSSWSQVFKQKLINSEY